MNLQHIIFSGFKSNYFLKTASAQRVKSKKLNLAFHDIRKKVILKIKYSELLVEMRILVGA